MVTFISSPTPFLEKRYQPSAFALELILLSSGWYGAWYESNHVDRVKRYWYLSPMQAATVQASLRICAVSPEPPLLAHTSKESRGTFRQKARYLAPLNGWACVVEICHDGMLEDTDSLDRAHVISISDITVAIPLDCISSILQNHQTRVQAHPWQT